MDDDIDIEEHDLLDNPAIRNIFPDLSILKKEISGFFEEASEIKTESDTFNTNEQVTIEHEYDDIVVSDSNLKYSQNDTPKTETALSPLFGNRIILGSKPSTRLTKTKLNDNYCQDLKVAHVYLNDIGSYLARSNRFCQICLTMFPQKRNYDKHKLAVHKQNSMRNKIITKNKITTGSIKKIHKCYECNESFSQQSLLRRHLINIHRKQYKKSVIMSSHTSPQVSSPLKMSMVQSSKLNHCFHCKVSFSSKRLLIEHIYKVLQSKSDKVISNVKSSERGKQHICQQMNTNLTLRKRMMMNRKERAMKSNHCIKTNNDKNINLVRPKSNDPVPVNVKELASNSVYQCVYCSYIFSNSTFCLKHIENKHRDSSITEVKAVIFDEQCKYCSKKNSTWKLHNVHMQMYHKNRIDETVKMYPRICLPKVDLTSLRKQVTEQKALTENNSDEDQMSMDESDLLDTEKHEYSESDSVTNDQLLLKSILFKCKRCDIHFLSAKAAMNHSNHMELLINWKCLSCNKIFKKVDEESHNKQHLFSNSFCVQELTETQLARILYKCSKCAIHFNSNKYLKHFDRCENSVAESVYCRVCDILIDKLISGGHENSHSRKKLKPEDFTILNSDPIGPKSVSKIVIKPFIKKKPEKIMRSTQFSFKVKYCKTCNSFLDIRGIHQNAHREARCSHLPTYVCRVCGLIFTNKTIGTHRIMHQERKGIRLQDFTFYDFKSGKQILPIIPQYPKCKNCDVHFISKIAVKEHICSEDFLTCNVCNIKLSEQVFKLHMGFHYYSNSKFDKDLSNIDKIVPSMKTDTNKRPPPRKRKTSTPDTSAGMTSSQESELNLNDYKEITEKGNDDGNVNVNSDKPYNECTDHSTLNTTSPTEASNDRSVSIKYKNLHQAYKMNRNYKKSDLALFNILYCCTNCHTTVDTYDAVVEHCQEHLCGINIQTYTCEICKLKLELKSYENHKGFHIIGGTNTSYKILKFDTFYFTLDNSIWIKHIFQGIEEEKSQQILNRSIYKYSGKIKMQVIQEGTTDNLTVYKCNSCFVIVDPESLLKHVENSCFKARKHPCSYCGLPFMSYVSLKKHSSVHKKMNVSLHAFKIVVINQEKDKQINKVFNGSNKCYLFYKCRKCQAVIDTYQRQNHTCHHIDFKKCSVCNMHFNSADFKAHLLRHKLVRNFIPKNMKIVLFGQGQINMLDDDLNQQNDFCGTIVDFTFIQCVKCKVCFEKTPITTFSHQICYEDNLLSKCSKCEFYILKNHVSRHSKLHNVNVHFVKENINIIPYDHSEQLSKFVPVDPKQLNDEVIGKPNSRSDKKTEYGPKTLDVNKPNASSSMIKVEKITRKTTKLLKCSCGLHFLDKTSIDDHFRQCNSKMCKQQCSKCNLMFTPAVLFSHLLLHHGDKKYMYTFDIIEMSVKKNCIVILYNCTKCKTHFVEYDKAVSHFENCEDSLADQVQCTKCELYFSSCSVIKHETLHHGDNVADVEIVEVAAKTDNEKNQEKTENVLEPTLIDNVLEPTDFVRESKTYNISDENLSQIDLNRYSSTIFKCEICDTHFLCHGTYRRHIANGKHVLPPQDTCNLCNLRFSLQSLTKHIYIHHKQLKLNKSDLIIENSVSIDSIH